MRPYFHFGRFWTVMITDFRLRFSRPSTQFVLLLTLGLTYYLIPDPATGYTMLKVNGHRALYTPDTIALGSATFCTVLLSLFGFYIASNALSLDGRSGVGLLLATTPVTNAEYIIGKFGGNLILISSLVCIQLLGSMVMFFIRGEGVFEVSPYMLHYGFICIPMVIYVSVMAIWFESLPLLSGRLGDIAYFFVWVFLLSLSAMSFDEESLWGKYIDPIGLLSLHHLFREHFNTSGFSIGAVDFSIEDPTMRYSGLPLESGYLLSRVISGILWLGLVVPALKLFHRYNPERAIAASSSRTGTVFLSLNARLKPLTDRLLPSYSFPVSFLNGVLQDAFLSLRQFPFVIVVGIGVWSLCLLDSDLERVRHIYPVVVYLSVVPLLTDLSLRDYRSGMDRITRLTSRSTSALYWRKFSAGLIILILLLGMALLRLFGEGINEGLSLLLGMVFLTSLSQSLGIYSKNQKPFIVLFLFLLYLTENSPREAALDFSGFFGVAGVEIPFLYAAGSLLFFLSSLGIETRRLLRQ